MAIFEQTHTQGAGFLSAIRHHLSAFTEAWGKQRLFQATYAELSQLSGRELADLGISRADIRRIAYEAAYPGAKTEYRQRH